MERGLDGKKRFKMLGNQSTIILHQVLGGNIIYKLLVGVLKHYITFFALKR